MLASAETVDAVAKALKRHGRPISIVDPVLHFSFIQDS
jgi:hydroxymethylpyrimidine/phosphomethylpyrimidine kinase